MSCITAVTDMAGMVIIVVDVVVAILTHGTAVVVAVHG